MSTINLKPSQPVLAAADLPALVDLYLADCETRLAPITCMSYRFALGYLTRWWRETGPAHGYQLTEVLLRAFARWLEAQPGQAAEFLAYNSRKMILIRVAQLFRWAHHGGYIQHDWAAHVPAADGEPPLRRIAANVDRLERLLSAAGQSTKPARDRAILALFLGTGLRRGELAGLNVQDVILYANQAGRLLVQKTKTRQPREAVFGSRAGEYLAVYLDAEGRTSGPLFVGYPGHRLSTQGVYNVVKSAIRRAGLDQEIQGPHDLRRAFVTVWMRGRRSLPNAQILSLQVGHTDPKMTLHYSLQTVEDVEESYISPLDLMG